MADQTSVGEITISYEEVVDPTYIEEFPARAKTFSAHLKHLDKLHPNKGRLLDVGAYTGAFMYLAKNRGWQVEGVEPSHWGIKQAKNHYNLGIKHGILKSGYFKNSSFDVVTMWDVIEHFPDPLASLKIASNYLKSGGTIAMTTIDVASPVARLLGARWPWFMQMHRVYFSKQTMRLMLQELGFTGIEFYPHIRWISLRYLLTRIKALIPSMPVPEKLLYRILRSDRPMLPIYAGDLFDVYAKKQSS